MNLRPFGIAALLASGIFTTPVWADRDSLGIWGGGGFASSSTQGGRFSGAKVIGGMRLPDLPDDKVSVRSSVSRVFDKSDTARYSLLVHIGYRIFDATDLAFLGGVGYLDSKNTEGTYLKPTIGGELVTQIGNLGSSSVSAFVAYEVFSGTTGTLALDGGSDDLTTRTISAGIVLSFRLLGDRPAALR